MGSNVPEEAKKFIRDIYLADTILVSQMKARFMFEHLVRVALSSLTLFFVVHNWLRPQLPMLNSEFKADIAYLILAYAALLLSDYWRRKANKAIDLKLKVIEQQKEEDLSRLSALTSDSINILLRLENLRKPNTVPSFKAEILEAVKVPELACLKFFSRLEEYANS